MSEQKHPELHVYEEQRDDLQDVSTAFGVFFAILFVIAIIATIGTIAMR